MPISEAPTKAAESGDKKPAENGSKLVSLRLETPWPEHPAAEEQTQPAEIADAQRAPSTSRWIDYDTHELLELIGELEDERRWARLREGVLWAVLLHALLLLGLFMLPKYVFQPKVIEPNLANLRQHDTWTYLDTPPEVLKPQLKKPLVNPLKEKPPPVIDKKTLEAMNRPPAPPTPAPAPAPEPPKAVAPAPPQPAPPIPPTPQGTIEAPRPSAVPARPNFNLGSTNPADQLRDAMRGAARRQDSGSGQLPAGGLAMHPGAGAGGLQILSDTQGVDFSSWIRRWYFETEHTWDPLIPDEVNPPILKSGMVVIRFKVLPNGRLMDGSVVLEGRSGDTALDRAAWGALTGSNYPPLPSEFHGPYLEMRAAFLYNMEPK
jgi:hypothetical protein